MAAQSRAARLIPKVADFRACHPRSNPKTFKEWITMNGKEAAGGAVAAKPV
jgi:hypothetical protein